MNETKFNGMGEIYSQFRPKYPEAFIEYLCSGVGVSRNSIVADIGSGTGILTKQILDTGAKVFAVEPNADMRVVAESDLSRHLNFASVNATAESTTLDDKSVDYITVAQAFHWFDKALFRKECGRILKQSGKVVLVWNTRVFTAESVKDSDEVNRKYCPNFKGFSGGMRGALYDATGEKSEYEFEDFFVGEYESRTFQNDQTLDFDGFIGRTLSASYALKENDKKYPSYIAELTECFNKHAKDGKMIMPIITTSYAGEV